MKTKIYTLLAIMIFAVGIKAQTNEIKVPAEIQPFVEKDSKAIALESADLNGDGTKDYILVLERENPTEKDKYDYPKNQRPLLILVRGKDNKLTEAKRNEHAVMCSECGGMMGDPFMGVEVGTKTFTVNHYGGSAWRWSENYKFNYSRIDKTWQLVQIYKDSFHAADQNKTMKRTILTPPKDFGKVDIADFDPSDYREKEDDAVSDSNQTVIEMFPVIYSGTATGFIQEKGDKVEYVVKAEKGYRMKASIIDVETPDVEGPVMIGYVTAPNGDEDGNFGGLFFDGVLTETGDYKIIVKQNEAKSGSTNIKFKIKVTLEKTE